VSKRDRDAVRRNVKPFCTAVAPGRPGATAGNSAGAMARGNPGARLGAGSGDRGAEGEFEHVRGSHAELTAAQSRPLVARFTLFHNAQYA
jgi:hypothetical protein